MQKRFSLQPGGDMLHRSTDNLFSINNVPAQQLHSKADNRNMFVGKISGVKTFSNKNTKGSRDL